MSFRAIADRAVVEHGAMQKPSELAAFLELLAPLKLESVLEIGGMDGGTMWCWAQVCAGPYVCVDSQVLGGRMEHAEGLDYRLIVADSTDPETPKQLSDQRFDLIFIDGSHRYQDVTKDAENWLPLLSDHGVVAFHDICHRRMRDHNMWRFWNEMIGKDVYYYDEIYDPEQQWGGIGVLSTQRFWRDRTWIEQTPPQCEDWVCECCCAALALEDGEDILCCQCAVLR